MTTLQTCGEWASGGNESDDATLELSTDRMWMQGRAPQKRLTLLQARPPTGMGCSPSCERQVPELWGLAAETLDPGFQPVKICVSQRHASAKHRAGPPWTQL